MVEFALVLPIFMLILSAILEFGFMLYYRMSVINSAREGARQAIMIQAPLAGQIVTTAKQAAVSAAAQGGITITDSNVTPTCIQTSLSPTSTTVINCNSAVAGDSVSVKVDYVYTFQIPLLNQAPITLSSTVQMVIE